MTFIVKKASKQAKKLRLNFSASSGAGKTLSALLAAYGITQDWSKICVVDSENDSASLYAEDNRFNIGVFNTIPLTAPYSPDRYIEALKVAQQEHDVVILDSITHEWNGPGGCLALHTKYGGDFRAWGKVTPMHDRFINAILTSTAHVFCTVRRKEEYAMVRGDQGMTVEKKGLNAVMRDGFDYEMDLVFEIENNNHMAVSTKDRTGIFDGLEPFTITEETGVKLREWAAKGKSELDVAMDAMREVKSRKEFVAVYRAYPKLQNNEDFLTLAKKKQEIYPKPKSA